MLSYEALFGAEFSIPTTKRPRRLASEHTVHEAISDAHMSPCFYVST